MLVSNFILWRYDFVMNDYGDGGVDFIGGWYDGM